MSYFELVCQNLKDRLLPLGDLKIDLSEVQQAAVALILRNREGEADVLIIKRAEHPRDPWSGHLALPGGRAEPEDADLLSAAIRETWEEVGIDLAAGGQFLGRLDTVSPLSIRLPRIAVTPLVAVASFDAVLFPNRKEVEDAFWLPLAVLKQQGPSDVVQLVIQGQTRQWPAYASPRGGIWGLTERMLTQFLALID
ncbi:MAG: CoA pyrophosphatase [Acidobacteria bacterium]|nr:CoA pyrophosphatase [Acidobacteriota bacterium]